MMTIEEAVEIARRKWSESIGCDSCGCKSAIHQYEPLESKISVMGIAAGYVNFPCPYDLASENGGHRGIRIYLT